MAQAKTVPCLVCGEVLRNENPRGNQPIGGLEFFSHGHWPSSVYDSMGDSILAVNICDACLKKAADQGRVLEATQPPVRVERKVKYQPWAFPPSGPALKGKPETKPAAGQKSSKRKPS